MEHFDVLVVGGGAAGMAAALGAEAAGARVLLVEQEEQPGGVLRQCLHRGFGLGVFGEDLTGPDYARRYQERLGRSRVTLRCGCTVLSLRADKTALLSSPVGLERVGFERCLLCCGCREKTLGSLPVGGSRPAGIFTAGEAQKLMNLHGYDIGRRAVILGSGDIGQIVARRLCIRGSAVVAMVEQKAALGGLRRNQRECIEAYHIPVILRATVEEVHGEGRVEGVTLHHLDREERSYLSCDTLITALGLVPERSLCAPLLDKGKLPSWLRLGGNCEHVHEIVDSATFQGEALGKSWREERP